jgi:tripartite-type tricarboxylate transporter receptor subunit TctC
VPTLKQAGYPLEYAQWAGLFVPAGTPDAVVEKLRAAAHKAADDAAVNAAINGSGSSIMYMDAPEFQTYLNADARKMADVVQKIGKVE